MPNMHDMIEQVKHKFEAADMERMCRERALFLADASLPAVFIFTFLLLPVAVFLMVYLVQLGNPKLSEPIQTVPLPQHGSAHVPVTPPPAYQERGDIDHPSSYADLRWGLRDGSTGADKDEDAATFVKGTAVLAVIVLLLFLTALSIQNTAWCHQAPVELGAVLWVVYGGLCLFALRGLGAWIILFRNLWGKKGREKVVVRDDLIVKGVFVILCLPYRGAVAGVKTCQKHMCGQHDEDQDVELGVTPSSTRFPPEVMSATDDPKSSREEDHKHIDEDPLYNDVAETRGLLSGQEGASS